MIVHKRQRNRDAITHCASGYLTGLWGKIAMKMRELIPYETQTAQLCSVLEQNCWLCRLSASVNPAFSQVTLR